jgi:hypothetical protein
MSNHITVHLLIVKAMSSVSHSSGPVSVHVGFVVGILALPHTFLQFSLTNHHFIDDVPPSEICNVPDS